jgi:energy-coupling factor transporter ATP-binding protein EcfA2
LAVLEHTGARALTADIGEIVSVLGAAGSGKSELARELALLRRPEEGTVLFHGADPMARRGVFGSGRRPHEVTLLVQNAEDQLFAKTVLDDVSFGPRHLGLSADEVEDRAMRALTAVGLNPEEVSERSPFALSGGERRRVALAGVLAMEPEVLVLDEPTANLDPRTRAQFLDLLAPLKGKSAIVWFTTSAQEAALADRAYLLDEGRTTEIPAGPSLLGDWRRLAEAGIELPPLYDLARSLEASGAALPDMATGETLKTSIIQAWRDRRD